MVVQFHISEKKVVFKVWSFFKDQYSDLVKFELQVLDLFFKEEIKEDIKEVSIGSNKHKEIQKRKYMTVVVIAHMHGSHTNYRKQTDESVHDFDGIGSMLAVRFLPDHEHQVEE